MKTIQQFLEELITRYETTPVDGSQENSTERDILRRLIKTGDMFIGYSSDKFRPNYMQASLQDDIDNMVKGAFALHESGSSVNAEPLFMSSTVKLFNQASDTEKENMLDDKYYWRAMAQIYECYRKFIDSKWNKKILENKRGIKSDNVWDALLAVEDFDNVTDEEIKNVFLGSSRDGNESYGIACVLFGEDRVIPLIAKYLREDAIASNINNYPLRIGESQALIMKIFKALDDETVPKYYPVNLTAERFFRILCKEDRRQLINTPMFANEVANRMWDDQESYDDITRYCAIIAKCCSNKAIPSYQLNKIKIFAPLVQMYGYNFNQIFTAIKGSFNEDGSIKQEVLALGKVQRAPKPEQTYYCVIKDGNIQIFKSEEERTAANIEGGMSYNFNKVQLRKKMDELLGN